MKKRDDGRYVETITLDGKRKFFYGATPAEVKRKLREFNEKLSDGRSFLEVADQWEDEHLERLAYNTQQSYKAPLRRLKEEFGKARISDITPPTISNYVNCYAAQGFGRQSVHIMLNILAQIFAYAVIHGDITYNPTTDIKLPKNLPSKKRELPSDEYIKLIDADKGGGDGLLPYLLLWCGCRRAEALALTWADIDFENKLIHVDKQVIFQSNTPVISMHTKTEAGLRDIILVPCLESVLRPLKGDPAEYVLGGSAPWTKTKLRRTWDRYCAKRGITHEENKTVWDDKVGKAVETAEVKSDLTPHQLRHAFATMMFECNIDEKTAMKQMGHADEHVIRDIYTHLREKKSAEAAEKLANFRW